MSKPDGERYRVAVDFDGVLHSYLSPWVDAETIPDPPVPGAIEWLREIAAHFSVVIFTTRGKTPEGQRAVRHWLHENGLEWGVNAVVTAEKPAALVYLDDRALRFEGRFPTKDEIHAARPWNKRPNRIAVDGPEELRVELTVNDVPVRVTKLPDDPLCLRASLGGTAEMGYYLSFRGDREQVQRLLGAALAALIGIGETGETAATN